MAELEDFTADMPRLLATRAWPSVTRWERVDGIPRAHDFDRALRAEVRDPLWMLARQWQLGELEGDDAGSPILAKLHLGTTQLTTYRPRDGTEQPFADGLPLEARVEQRPVAFRANNQPLALDLRLVMGRQWTKLLVKRGLGGYADGFRRAFAVPPPPAPDDETGAAVLAHRETWQQQAAFGDRALDGRAWYEWIVAHPAPRDLGALPAPLAIAAADAGAVNDLADAFVAWFDRLVITPRPEDSAWDPQRLEYRFACSAPSAGGRREFDAEQFPGGHLDWYAFDQGERTGRTPVRGEVDTATTTTFVPVVVEYNGMANTRWWSFEDRRVNWAGIQPDTTDLAKLLVVEFGLVYANDWCVVPVPVANGSIARVLGLVVTNVFGERLWIEPAGTAPGHDWQRWQMFQLSPGVAGLLMLPTVPKVQDGPLLEDVNLVRDEMANMVWGVESTVPLPHGQGRAGSSAASETAELYRRLRSGAPAAPVLTNDAKIRYDLMSTVPENWIPFIPVHVPGSTRQIQLQRASMPRIIENDTGPLERIKPLTALLREGLELDPPAAYFIHEEEVPRAGARIAQAFRRTRWTDGSVVVWLGAHKEVGRGEGSSGLDFDRLVDVKNRG